VDDGNNVCEYNYNIQCNFSPPQITGDPAFVGIRGQQYQVHGVSGEIYNIVSDPSFQYNAKFVFLDGGKCPIVDGRKMKGCWAHAGSYLGQIGIKTTSGNKLQLVAGSADQGFEQVLIDGKSINIGDDVFLGNEGSVTYNSTHVVTVNIGSQWSIEFSNSDKFINQMVHITEPDSLSSHGLFGQTWRKNVYKSSIKHIEGIVDDYVIREKELFGDSFLYNKFN